MTRVVLGQLATELLNSTFIVLTTQPSCELILNELGLYNVYGISFYKTQRTCFVKFDKNVIRKSLLEH